MPDKLRVFEELKLAKIESTGVVTDMDIAKSIETVVKLFEQGKISKVMVDTRKQEILPDSGSLYFLAEKFSHGLKIAIVIRKDQKTKMGLKFFETAALNKGKSFKVFESIGAAEKWLNL